MRRGRLGSVKYICLPYSGGIKGEEELEGEAAFAGWGLLLSIFRGVFALGRFGFSHRNSI